jgi:hypothetical protein
MLTGSRKVILPADQATESQPRLCDLPHIGEGPVGVGIASEHLKSVAEVLIKDNGHSLRGIIRPATGLQICRL